MRRQIAALIVGMLACPLLVSGQTVAPGARVRFSTPGEDRRTGTLVALTPDTLEVRVEGRASSTRLPLDQITRLDVSRGREQHLMSRAGLGFVLGAGLGALGTAAVQSGCHPSGDQFCFGTGDGALIGGIFYGAVGGVVGLIAGAIPSESWEKVSLEPRRITVVAPSSNGRHGVGLRVAF